MPLIHPSTYTTTGIFKNKHIHTIIPSQLRRIKKPPYQRERIATPDGDFLDLDWLKSKGAKNLLIILHGLEGSSESSYVKGISTFFHGKGWDTLALNFRGCSGEPNRLLRSYHSGDTEDLHWVVMQILSTYSYQKIFLSGFSLGGNVLLKYLGESHAKVPKEVRAGIAVSTPVDIADSAHTLSKVSNWIYVKHFMLSLNPKLRQKQKQFPGQVHLPKKRMPRTFAEFDGWFTAPVHGFRDAEDYWKKASSKPHLKKIKVPTLILQPQDDPFLGNACYPVEICRDHTHLYLESPPYGGHVGMIPVAKGKPYWAEQRAWEFFTEKG
ncbi:MAG: alpha/beta fold hydrolase [Bacteroidota bacterium]